MRNVTLKKVIFNKRQLIDIVLKMGPQTDIIVFHVTVFNRMDAGRYRGSLSTALYRSTSIWIRAGFSVHAPAYVHWRDRRGKFVLRNKRYNCTYARLIFSENYRIISTSSLERDGD